MNYISAGPEEDECKAGDSYRFLIDQMLEVDLIYVIHLL